VHSGTTTAHDAVFFGPTPTGSGVFIAQSLPGARRVTPGQYRVLDNECGSGAVV
jgi:hypothetical protein